MKRLANRQMRARKTRDAALIVPLMGLTLLTPPVAQMFAIDSSVLGVPTVVVYIFTVWAGLIYIARRLALRLSSAEQSDLPEE